MDAVRWPNSFCSETSTRGRNIHLDWGNLSSWLYARGNDYRGAESTNKASTLDLEISESIIELCMASKGFAKHLITYPKTSTCSQYVQQIMCLTFLPYLYFLLCELGLFLKISIRYYPPT